MSELVLSKFDALLTTAQCEAIEKRFQSDSGVTRRILLALLSQDSEALQAGCLKEPGALFESFTTSVDYVERLRHQLELFEAAVTRLMISLCALDWDSESCPFTREEFDAVCAKLNLQTGLDEGNNS